MRRGKWFLPEIPDVLGMLRAQTAVTVEGMEALDRWARDRAGAAAELRNCEHRADARKRELRQALTVAFTTPLDPEDLFELSRGLDDVLNAAKNLVREAEVMDTGPDPSMAAMTDELARGTHRLAGAFDALAARRPDDATAAADDAVKTQRRLERAYRAGMSALVDVPDVREITARRELYRRLARMGEDLAGVAERVWYSVLKES
jgi:uncharacterized protein Yka (UPF0111/DUF47 family)